MHQKRYTRSCLLLFTLLAALPPAGSATTQELLSNTDLVTRADAIVVGRCVAVATEWRDRALVTRYTIAVDDALHGAVSSEVTLWVPGGMDLDRKIPIAVTIPGAPTLFANEEVLLFLETVPGFEGYSLASLTQGKVPIRRGATGEPFVRWDFPGEESGSSRSSLASVKAAIRSLLQQEESR